MTTSSTLRTGSTPRRTTSLAALMALVVAFSFGFVASASAEPTPVESPSATPTDPGIPDPTADPDVTPSTSSSPTQSSPNQSTPAPSQDPTTPAPSAPAPPESADVDADEDAEPGAETEASEDDEASTPSGKDSTSRVKVSSLRTKLLSARSGPFASTGITPNVAVSEGGNLLSLSLPGCAPAGGTATLDELIGFIDEDQVSQDESLDWVIDGPALDAPLTGTVSFDEGIGEFSVTGLEQGDYTLVFSLEGGVQLEDAFKVLGCVTTTVSCAAISFTNPSTNPEVTVDYGPVVEDDEFDEDFGGEVVVAPGRTVTAYTGDAAIGWAGYWSDPIDFDGGALPEGIFRISSAGEVDEVDIPQDGCAAVVKGARADCSKNSTTPAEIEFSVEKLDGVSLSYEIWAVSGRRPIAQGQLAPGEGAFVDGQAMAPGVGAYELRLYVEDSETPYEVVEFVVATCVKPVAKCGSVLFSNPSSNPTVEVLYGRPGTISPDGSFSLEPGAERLLSTDLTTLHYAIDSLDEDSLALAGFGDVKVKQDCDDDGGDDGDTDGSTGSGSGAAPVSGGGAVLADTGASTGPLGLMGIALLLATGAALVIKGRRSQLS